MSSQLNQSSDSTYEDFLYQLACTAESYAQKIGAIAILTELNTEKSFDLLEKYLYRELCDGGKIPSLDDLNTARADNYHATYACVSYIASLADSGTPEAVAKVKRVLLPALLKGTRPTQYACAEVLDKKCFCTADVLEVAHKFLNQSLVGDDELMVQSAYCLIESILEEIAKKTS